MFAACANNITLLYPTGAVYIPTVFVGTIVVTVLYTFNGNAID
jgi:hypothetical protein